MLEGDRLWNKLTSRLRLWRMVTQFLIKVSPAMLRSLAPGYHPSKVKDPAWVSRWTDAYTDLPENIIPLLDTSHPDIPAQFVR
ncbi:hypothetical protein, partial [Parasphingorhabdus sp.]